MDSQGRQTGFSHTQVAQFIHREVLRNGGSPDFYITNRNLTWNRVEDKLQKLIKDPTLTRPKKRAYAWSALALNVRFGARQAHEHNERAQSLLRQLGEARMTASSTAWDLQTMREDYSVSRLQHRRYREHLQRAQLQVEQARERLRHAENMASQLAANDAKPVPTPTPRDIWAASLPRDPSVPSQNQAAPDYETLYLQSPPFELGSVSEAAAAVMFPPCMLPRSRYLPGSPPIFGTQGDMVQPCNQSTRSQESAAQLRRQSIRTEEACAGAKGDPLEEKGWCHQNVLQQGLQVKIPKCTEESSTTFTHGIVNLKGHQNDLKSTINTRVPDLPAQSQKMSYSTALCKGLPCKKPPPNISLTNKKARKKRKK